MLETASTTGQAYDNLCLLRIHLEGTSDGPEAIFEIFVHGSRVGRLTLPAKLLGLPRDGANLEASTPLGVPAYIKRSLASGFALADAEQEPIWLSIDRPSGLLAIIPWERALRPEIKRQLLRLPHLPLKPFMPREYLDIAVCFAAPDQDLTAGTVAGILRAIPPDLAKEVRLHAFASSATAAACLELAPTLSGVSLEVHDSAAAGRVGEAPVRPAVAPDLSEIANPWLLWMCAELDDTSLDCVQFVASGSLADEQGRLDFAPLKAPEAVGPARSNAREISAFLERTGAWSLALISPSASASNAGLRMLQDQVGWLNPIPIYMSDIDLGPGATPAVATGLQAANRFILGAANAPIPTAEGLSLMCHPRGAVQPSGLLPSGLQKFAELVTSFDVLRGPAKALAAYQGAPAFLRNAQAILDQAVTGKAMEEQLDEYTLADRLKSTLTSSKNPPSWIASAQRNLERSLAQLDDIESDSLRDVAKQVLAKVANLIDQKAQSSAPQVGTREKIINFFKG